MKKIMLVLALFMSVGLFANASNGKIFKVKISVGELTPKTSSNNKMLGSWMYTVTCGGSVYTGCCWETSAQAYMNGEMIAARRCVFN